MSQTQITKIRGLYTYPNQLGELPEGALTAADNTVIDRDSVVSPRRGLAIYGDSLGSTGSFAKQLMYYKARLLRHWGSDLDFDNDGSGTFVNLSTTVTEPATGIKIKFQEANANFYFTSSQGIQKISSTNAAGVVAAGITPAGGIEALDGVAYLNNTPGWFTQDSQVAYRIVWGIKDNNQNLVLGTPSQRIVITNSEQSLVIGSFNKLLGALDIAASTPDTVLTGDTHSNTTIDNLSSTANLSIGMTVTGTDIPSGTIITEINSGTAITISQAATATTPGESLTFGQNLSDTDYSTLSLSTGAAPGDVYNGLTALSKKLDADMGEQIYYGLTGAITDIIPSISVNVTGNLNGASGSNTTITNISSMTNISPGLFVTGNGVPANTTVSSVSIGGVVSFVGTTTSGSTDITGVSSVAGLVVGMSISGPGIPLGSSIVAIGVSDVSIDQAIVGAYTGVSFNAVLNEAVISNPVTTTISNTPLNFSFPTIIVSDGHGLVTGQQITITGSNSNPIVDTTGAVTVTVLSADTFTIPTTTVSSGNAGTWTLYPPAVAANFQTAPSDPATTAQLTLLQNFYDEIVNNLNVDENISIDAKTAIGGTFANSVQSATTNIIFTIPKGITTAYFYQVYRSDMSTSIGQGLLSDQSADDEMKLIDEENPSSQDLTNGFINFFDDIPESFRLNGANLYTNAISGAGILQENNIPPYAQDITLWMTYMFFANASQKHQLEIDLLTGTGLVGNTFTTSWNGVNTTYTFVDEVNQITSITTPAASAFPSSGAADYFDIFNAQNYSTYRFYFDVGTVTPPSGSGVTLIPVTILTTDSNTQVASKLQYALFQASQDFTTAIASNVLTVVNNNTGFTNSPVNHVTASGFSITVSTSGSGERASTQSVGVPTDAPTPAQEIDGAARSLVRIVNQNPNGGVQAQYISSPTSLPGQIEFEAIAMNLVPIYFTASAPIADNFNPSLPASGQTVVSDNQYKPNRIYYSKTQQPDAVPAVNFFDVGQEDYAILRIMPLRDSLFILKEDGVFRLYGNDPSNFSVYLFDSSTKLLAQDTAVVLNNQVYMFCNQGVVTVSDTGVSVISRPIEGTVIPVNTFSNFTSTSFGVTYEADRAYMLWLQESASDTVPTVCYRYSTFTNTWVRWPISKNCGVVIPDSNILYVGPTDTNFIEKERKTYQRFDQTDREYVQQIPANGVSGTVFKLGSVFEAQPGDAIVQTQYLTISQYNRLINKIGTDLGMHNDYSGQIVSIAANLRDSLTSLATELDTDTGLVNKNYASSIAGFGNTFLDTQNAFNTIIGLLNSDAGARLHNYSQSTYTTGWESIVQSIDVNKETITVTNTLPWIQGPITIFKAISTAVEWAPQHCGDPSMLKKIYEGTMMFENMAFDGAILSYSSDLYTGTQPINVNGDGCDIWGGVTWGNGTWGGDGTFRPIRTYIPVPVQRCRFVQAYFDHNTSMRTYAIFGISYTWEPISSRAYR